VLGNFVKRLVNAAVLGLAAFTFFLVPIGQKTAFQHAVAVFTSPPAREAGAAIADSSRRVADAVQEQVHKVLGDAKPQKPPADHDPRQ
jgi:hypothetical protein